MDNTVKYCEDVSWASWAHRPVGFRCRSRWPGCAQCWRSAM